MDAITPAGGAARDRPGPWTSREPLAALALIGCALLLAWIPMRTLDPAGDEVAHVGAAYDTLLTGKERLNLEHPALMKRLAGIGMRWHEGGNLGARMDRAPHALDQWQYGNAVLYPDGQVDTALLHAARLPFLLVVALGALCVWLWSRALFGAAGGLLSLAFYAASPVVAAHGSLVVTDFLVGVFALAQFALLWHAWRGGPLAAAALGGAAGALACYSKYSGPVAVVLVPLLLLLPSGTGSDRGAAYLRRRLALGAAYGVGAGALALLFAGPHCLADYASGIGNVYRGFATDYRYFALGASSPDGFWYYFPLTLLLKSTPAELLALLALAILALPGRRAARAEGAATARDLAWIWLFPSIYLVLLAASALNWGHRYTAPVYLFAFVAFGGLAHAALPRLRVLLPAGLLAVQALAAVLASPDPLTYFNGLLGCSGARAARCLDDSNIDWGQNDGRLAAGLRARQPDGPPVIGVWSPDPVGMRARVPGYVPMTHADWYRPRPALYAVSGHYLARIWVLDPGLSDSPLYRALMRGDSITRSFLVADLRERAAP